MCAKKHAGRSQLIENVTVLRAEEPVVVTMPSSDPSSLPKPVKPAKPRKIEKRRRGRKS
jgi:hypothetical protein